MKKIIIMLMLVFVLVSCWTKEEKWDNMVNVNNPEEIRVERSEEEIKADIIESSKKNITEAVEWDRDELLKEMKDCDTKEDKDICKTILVETFWIKAKKVDVCELLDWERNIKRCKIRIVSRLVSREKDTNYCSMLDDTDKQMCIGEYERTLEEEIKMFKEIEWGNNNGWGM